MRQARRLWYLLALIAATALGLASRTFSVGWSLWDKSLGDVLYAIGAYLAVAKNDERSQHGSHAY